MFTLNLVNLWMAPEVRNQAALLATHQPPSHPTLIYWTTCHRASPIDVDIGREGKAQLPVLICMNVLQSMIGYFNFLHSDWLES